MFLKTAANLGMLKWKKLQETTSAPAELPDFG